MTSIVLKLIFEYLVTDRDRAIVEMQIVNDVLTKGIEVRRNIILWQFSKKGVQYKVIASCTMYSWFAILLISSTVFADVFKTLKRLLICPLGS